MPLAGWLVRAHRQPPRHGRALRSSEPPRSSSRRSRAASRGSRPRLRFRRRASARSTCRRTRRDWRSSASTDARSSRRFTPRSAPAASRGRHRRARRRRRGRAAGALRRWRRAAWAILSRGRRLLPPEADDRRRGRRSRARRGRSSCSVRRRSSRCSPRAPPPTGAPFTFALARGHGGRGCARLHRVLARDGDEPHGRRPPERPLGPVDAGAAPAACWRPPARRSRSSSARAGRRSPASPRWAPVSASSCRAVPRRWFDAGVPGERRYRGGLDDRLARLPRGPAGDRVRRRRRRAAGRTRHRRARHAHACGARGQRRAGRGRGRHTGSAVVRWDEHSGTALLSGAGSHPAQRGQQLVQILLDRAPT